ncbi:hypothetical protein [Aliiglaciecola aliphaticivorans]
MADASVIHASDGDGNLLGTKNVLVDGILYDVVPVFTAGCECGDVYHVIIPYSLAGELSLSSLLINPPSSANVHSTLFGIFDDDDKSGLSEYS